MQVKTLTVLQAIEFIFATKGRFFGIKFIKKSTGLLREMTARMGVRKGVTGKGRRYDADRKGLLGVYDVTEQDFRVVPVDNITAVKCGGDWIPVKD